MKNVFESFEGKEAKNVWAITGGDGVVVDGEDCKTDDRGDAR